MTDRPAPFIGALRVPWLRPLAQALRVLAIVSGCLAAWDVGFTRFDIAIVVFLAGFLVWRWLPVSARVARLRDVLVVEMLVTMLIVVATGGWSSGWLLAHMVPLGLAALGVVEHRAIALGVGSVVMVSIGTIGSWPRTADTFSRASTLMLVVIFSVIARRILSQTVGESDETIGQLEQLWNVRALLEGLHTEVSGSRARFNVGEALAALRAAAPVLAAADVVALLVLQDDGTLRTLHGTGLPRSVYRVRDLPDRVGAPRRDGLPLAVSLPGGGLVSGTDEGAYLWLPVPVDEPPHILVVEAAGHLDADEALPELSRIAQPLAITISNAAWFARVRHLGVDEERQRIAAQLHDHFAQSLAVVQLELELALRRHPGDEGLIGLKSHVKDSLGQLRDTMVELRATVDDDHPLPVVLASLTRRLADRHGVVSELTIEGEGQRPMPAVEQQLLRIAQELTRRAVQERGAIAVYVRYVCDDVELRLEVTDDGEAPTQLAPSDAQDVIRERAEAIGATVEATAAAGRGLSRVSVVASRTKRSVGVRT